MVSFEREELVLSFNAKSLESWTCFPQDKGGMCPSPQLNECFQINYSKVKKYTILLIFVKGAVSFCTSLTDFWQYFSKT